MELLVPRDWLKLAVPVPEKFTTPAEGVTMLNICSGSALAVPAMSGAAASTAATKRGRFMMLSSKWSPPKAGLSQGWSHETHNAGVFLLRSFWVLIWLFVRALSFAFESRCAAVAPAFSFVDWSFLFAADRPLAFRLSSALRLKKSLSRGRGIKRRKAVRVSSAYGAGPVDHDHCSTSVAFPLAVTTPVAASAVYA